ncbi:MAG: hemolysin family protein [Kosmotogaceae bacterium]
MGDPGGTGDPLYIVLNLFFLGFLLFLSGLFSGSETALTSIGKLRLRDLIEKEKGRVKKKSLHMALVRPNRVLTVILVMNNLVNILASSEATLLTLQLLPDSPQSVAAALVTGIMTFLILVFGEITPKIFARENSEKLVSKVCIIIYVLSKVLKPVIWLLMELSNIFIVIIGGKRMDETPFITEGEIVSAVDYGHEDGILQPEERIMMKRSLELKEISVKEIMTPRVEIVCVDENASIAEFIKVVREEGYSRIPIYRNNIDRIVGICYAKDLFIFFSNESEEELLLNKPVKEIMRPPYFIPETKKLDDLMREFKKRKIHLAVVIDEYGGTGGIVTLEDILEEFTGEILDEYDVESEELTIRKVGEDEYIVDGMTPINDIERELDVEFPETDFETIGGYLLEILERFPKIEEEIEINGFRFEIMAVTKNRIEKIKLYVNRRNDSDEPEEDID